MVILSEQKESNLSKYAVISLDDEGEVLHERKISFPLYELSDDNKVVKFILYDDQWVPNDDFFRYLNIEMSGRPLTSRRKVAHALRLLYIYLSYVNKPLTGINREVRDGLRRFLKGTLPGTESYHLLTVRSNATVNAYLSCYRQYLLFLEITSKALFRTQSVSVTTFADGDFNMTREALRFDSNMRVNPHKTDFLPSFIGPQEFSSLLW